MLCCWLCGLLHSRSFTLAEELSKTAMLIFNGGQTQSGGNQEFLGKLFFLTVVEILQAVCLVALILKGVQLFLLQLHCSIFYAVIHSNLNIFVFSRGCLSDHDSRWLLGRWEKHMHPQWQCYIFWIFLDSKNQNINTNNAKISIVIFNRKLYSRNPVFLLFCCQKSPLEALQGIGGWMWAQDMSDWSFHM